MRKSSLFTAVAVSVLLFASFGCENGDDGDGGVPSPTLTQTPVPTPTPTSNGRLDISICAPDAGPFSADINNPFFPLSVGAQWILTGENDEGAPVRVVIASLDDTEVVAGVTARVVEEREWEDGELVEVSRNFFVQTSDGTVCYYGEDVDDYEAGQIVDHGGAWRAGVKAKAQSLDAHVEEFVRDEPRELETALREFLDWQRTHNPEPGEER